MLRAIKRLFRSPKNKEYGIGGESRGGYIPLWAPRYEAGKFITYDSALSFGAVYASVRIISESIASLPWPVFLAESDGSRRRLVGNHVHRLLNRRANAEMGAFAWRETALGHVLLWGNHYSEIERDASNRPVGLWPIHPYNVETKREDGRITYEVRDNAGNTREVAPDDMFHFHGLGSDGLVGYSVVGLAARSIAMGIASEEFGASFFGNGAHLGAIISQKDGAAVLNQDGVSNLLKTFNRKHQGSAQAHKVEYLDGGLTYQEVGVKPEDAQFLESRKFSVEEIARWFRVPPHKLAQLERATFSNIEHQSTEFVTDTLLPWCVRLEQEANYKLLGASAPAGMYTKLELKGLLRGDLQTRTQFYKEMRFMGAYSVNDILMLEDQNPIGEEGDIRIVPMNMTTLERMMEGPEPVAPEPPTDESLQAKAQFIAELRSFDSQHIKMAQQARGRYTRAEFFEWREAYMSDQFGRMVAGSSFAHNSEWVLDYRARVETRMLAEYDGEEWPDDIQELVEWFCK